jgi:hypothetical protein
LDLLASLGLFDITHRAKSEYLKEQTWLAHDERADGTLRSPNLYIWWYDAAARRERSTSTGTVDEGAAILALDKVYLAGKEEAPAFCHACGQPLAQAQAYLLTDAIADYKIEWGDTRASADTIAGWLAHVVGFLDAEEALGAEGRFGLATSCAVACSSVFVDAFRAWSASAVPVAQRQERKSPCRARARRLRPRRRSRS